MQKVSLPKVIAIVGPTASGKTSLSIELAERFGGEVISADSRQVYRGLDVGTGKITATEMQGIPHHLIDIADASDVYTANDFVRDAAAAITDISARSRIPIIAGGTFFYLDLLRGRRRAAPVPPNPTLRSQLENLPTNTLFTRLQTVVPTRATTIDPHNRRRLIRALEIYEALGTIPDNTTAQPDNPYAWLLISLSISPEQLKKNFRARAENWLQNGLREETQWLLDTVGRARLQEFGFEYQLALALLEGTIDTALFMTQFEQKNWQYAKRQLTWLKRDANIEWFAPENRAAIFSRADDFLTT